MEAGASTAIYINMAVKGMLRLRAYELDQHVMALPPKTSLNAGHRRRLRMRFGAYPNSVPDYELLELLLFLSLPRVDTKIIAKQLLQRTGSLAALLGSPPSVWSDIPGVGEQTVHVMQLVQQIHISMLRHAVKQERDILNCTEVVVQYCRARMAYDTRERVWLLFLNTKHALLGDEEHEIGTLAACAVFPREVVKRALEIGAAGLIMVHNHPSGDASPSGADIELTHAIKDVCRNLDLALLDHIIVTPTSFVSMRSQRHLGVF